GLRDSAGHYPGFAAASSQSANYTTHRRYRISQLALPNHKNLPSRSTERGKRSTVSCTVVGELGFPECTSCLRDDCAEAARVPMPKTPVDEYGHLRLSEYQIRTSWKITAM